jgi:hypothetical protein
VRLTNYPISENALVDNYVMLLIEVIRDVHHNTFRTYKCRSKDQFTKRGVVEPNL